MSNERKDFTYTFPCFDRGMSIEKIAERFDISAGSARTARRHWKEHHERLRQLSEAPPRPLSPGMLHLAQFDSIIAEAVRRQKNGGTEAPPELP